MNRFTSWSIWFSASCFALIFSGGCSSSTAPGVSGSWSTGPSTTGGGTANFVNGKIYLMWGFDSETFVHFQSFNPLSNTWSKPSTIGTTDNAISLFCASAIDDRIYLLGGSNYLTGRLSTVVEVFDPGTTTLNVPPITGDFTGRYEFASAALNGKIYVFGGLNQYGSDVSTVNVYDPATNSWSAPLIDGVFTPRNRLSCSVLNGKIYVMGGQQGDGYYSNLGLSTLEVFDPSTNTWNTPTTSGHLNGRAEFTTAVLNGKIYVMGGYSVDGQLYKVGIHVHDDMQVFDPSTNTWSTVVTSGTFTPRYGLTSVVVGGKIYAIGGGKLSGDVNAVEVFTPAP